MSTRYSTSLLGLCILTAAAGLLSPAAAQQWVMPRTHPEYGVASGDAAIFEALVTAAGGAPA